MYELYDKMRQEAARVLSRVAQPRIGIVTSYDAATHRAKVDMMPQAVGPLTRSAETSWLPIATQMVGPGWGIYAGMTIGEQVLVVHQEGHLGGGIIVGRINNMSAAPAPAVPSGEIWMVHGTTSRLKFLADGTIEIISNTGSSLRFLADGSLHVKGNLYVTGDVFDQYGSMDAHRVMYNGHAHDDPNEGLTGLPTLPIPRGANPDPNAGKDIV